MFNLLQSFQNENTSSELRKPKNMFINTKTYLETHYSDNQEKIDYFKSNVYNQSFNFIKSKDSITSTIDYNTEYISLIQECIISYCKTEFIIMVDGDVIIDTAFPINNNYENKLIYYNNEIYDLYDKVNEHGTLIPEISYPTFPLNFSEIMDLNSSTQWLECSSDFRSQLITNLCFKEIKIKKDVNIMICTTKLEHKNETILFDINLSYIEDIKDIYFDCDGFLSDSDKEKVMNDVIKFINSYDKLCFNYVSYDSLFDKYDVEPTNPVYYSIVGGVKGTKFMFLDNDRNRNHDDEEEEF
jgi:hypothetical protein